MKSIRKAALSAFLAISVILSTNVPAFAEQNVAPYFCNTSEELAIYVLKIVEERKQDLIVKIPNYLPEADMGSFELLKHIYKQDSGFIRWGHGGTAFSKARDKKNTTFNFTMFYRTTKEQDDAAIILAAEMVEKWKVGNLSEREKINKLKSYISANWRYDMTLENLSAYPTMVNRKGTCLGFVMACQLLLNEMGIPSQTIHGKFERSKETHIRMLVKLGNLWYTFDPTGLASDAPDLSAHLKSSYTGSFIPDSEYLTEEFRRGHPMNRGDLALL